MTVRTALIAAVFAGAGVLTMAPAHAAAPQQAARDTVCLDTTNSRADLTKVRLWRCVDHSNQKWVIRNGQIIVANTIGWGNPVCLDAPGRDDRTNVILYRCQDGNDNQSWVVRGGRVIVADTVGSDTPACLDAPGRANNTNVILYRCQDGNANQNWVSDRGEVQVADTRD